MGTGRSGTTVLEILLSDDDKICSVGELTHIFQDGFVGDQICACGASFSRCEFWKRVQQRISYPTSQLLQVSDLLHTIDWHSGFLKLIFHAVPVEKIRLYNNINNELYAACAAVSGKRIVIDSSKYPARALMLNRLYGAAVKIICLTRSPEGMLASFQKTEVEQPPKKPLAVLLYYVYVLLCCRLVAIFTKNVHFISFEELSAFPFKTIKGIENFTGVSFEESRKRIEEDRPFTPGHIITGNRLKNSRAIYFQKKKTIEKEPQYKHKILLFLMKTSQKMLGFS